ncbi:MAG: thioredoxin family protein [Candidatus Hydrothermarchaeaceae archaeon]
MNEVVLVIADWCPICPRAKSLWRNIRKEYDFDYKEVDISSKEGSDLVAKHSIRSVPTTIIDGSVAFIGVPDRDGAVEAITNSGGE